MIAYQGNKYRNSLTGRDVIALSSGERVSVADIYPLRPWPLGHPYDMEADRLEPLPMRYHGDELP